MRGFWFHVDKKWKLQPTTIKVAKRTTDSQRKWSETMFAKYCIGAGSQIDIVMIPFVEPT